MVLNIYGGQKMSNRKIMLIDGSSIAFRAFYSILDLNRFQNKSGLHTNALFSFHRMLDNIMKEFEPSHVLVAFDVSDVTFRTEKYTDYKAGRQKTPSEFKEQMPYFSVLLDAYGIKHYRLANYEADDIIGTLAYQADPDDEVIIISGDKDLIQLASDNVTVNITRKGVSQLEAYTPEMIQDTYGLSPNQIIDLKGLTGDSSDNYPGVTRVGEKTGLKLLHQFETMENLYDNLDQLKPSKMKENLINDKEQAFMSKDLAIILKDAPVEVSIDDIELKDKNIDALIDFYRQMDFNSFLTDLYSLEGIEPITEEKEDELEFEWEELTEIKKNHLPQESAIYFESLEDNYHFGNVIKLAWSDKAKKKVYLADPELAFSNPNFIQWLEDERVEKVSFDSKRDLVLASHHNIDIKGIVFDVLIGAYLIDTHNSNEIANIVESFNLPITMQVDEVVFGKGAKLKVPEDDILLAHVANKVAALQIVVDPIRDKLKELEMLELYQEIDFPLASVLAKMEILGIKVDGQTLEAKNEELLERLGQMEKRIHALAGEEFNVASPKQLGIILFEKLGLPVIKKTKTSYSTAADVLDKLLDKHPIIQEVLDYRQVSKLQGTYLAGLPGYIKKDGKIHTRFIQTLTQTGRLSSSDPNLQNIPIRLEEGRKIRQAFVPSEEGWQLFGADYSQIELRVLAHISADPHMKEAFVNGEDIHSSTARRVLNVPEDQAVSEDMRRQAKAVNFGIVYGISDYGLSQNLNISRPQAKEFIDTYFEKYPGVKEFMTDIVEKAREQGYIETLFNRRRYLADIQSSNYNIRSFAERTAMNSPIQGTAADIIKIAMINLQKVIEDKGLKARLLLQIHDELILEAPAEEMEILSEIVPEVMENAVKLDVPLLVEYNQGSDWFELT